LTVDTSESFINAMASTTTLSERFSRLDVSNEAPLLLISSDRDTLTDDEHKDLDDATMNSFRIYREINKEPSWPDLLFNITGQDERLARLSSKKAMRFLDDNPRILQILKSAWTEGTFKEVRKLGAFLSLLSAFVISASGNAVAILWPKVEEQSPVEQRIMFRVFPSLYSVLMHLQSFLIPLVGMGMAVAVNSIPFTLTLAS
jgi:hypothetical protein